jgi:predicted acylesterase/phospholipase RssA/CRP-like cAMP-binding protein
LDIRSLLAQTHLFVALSRPALDQLVGATRVRQLASGETLLKIGSPADSLFIVAVGRLRVALEDGTIVNDVGRLEPVGEISLLSGEPRSATVYAVRDTTVLEISRMALYEVFAQHPSALLTMSRMIIQRLRQNQRVAKLASVRRSRSFALIAGSPGVDIEAFADALCREIGPAGAVGRLDRARVEAALGSGRADTANGACDDEEGLIDWLQQQELDHAHLVYVSTYRRGEWLKRCMRQADRVVLLASAHDDPTRSEVVAELRASGLRVPVDLVLLRPDGARSSRVLQWRDVIGSHSHYFVRPGNTRDVARVARSLTGRAVGLVLGGGGARGFAHLGVLRALEELKIDVDVTGGSSMGAFISALLACGHPSSEILRLTRETFVNRNLLNDYLFPSVSLIRGRKFLRRLTDIFGDRRIEELPTPYYCVSTNLTRGTANVHDRGPLDVWLGTSMCIPGVAPPVAYKGELLVDGAVVNSLPTDVMQALERGPIIASDVSTEGGIGAPGIEGPDPEGLLNWAHAEKRPSLLSILFRTATLTSESGVAARAARADLYLRMPVTGIGLFDWKRIDELADRGYQYAMERLPEFHRTVCLEGRPSIPASPAAAPVVA